MKNSIFRYAIMLFLLICFLGSTEAQTVKNAALFPKQTWSFEENRGQLADENGAVLKDIKYYGTGEGISVYLRKNKISFVFTKAEIKNKVPFSEATGMVSPEAPYRLPSKNALKLMEETEISSARINMELIGANADAQVLAEDKIDYYTNYFLAHTPESGITHVPHFRKITYKNIYRQIDLVLYVKQNGLKYEFVVHPEGKVSNIKLQWSGTTPRALQNGGIKYSAALGEINETAPLTYTADGKTVKSWFTIHKNTLGFEVEKYDRNKALVIDPDLIWATYYGGEDIENDVTNSGEGGYAITANKFGEVIMAGITCSASGIATVGSHQSAYNDNWDGFIVKFDSSGKRMWGTYFGGQKTDACYAICTDINSNIYVSGNTNSLTGIATSNANQTVHAGAEDGFIAKFNNDGERLWSTYLGKADGEYLSGIAIGKNNLLYILGTTQSDGLATSGVYQEKRSGKEDVFIAQYNSNGVKQWLTYYGGENTDYGMKICTDMNDNLYIIGNTISRTRIATPGTHKTAMEGSNSEVFITKFNKNGERIWSTYYGGLFSDEGYGICTDYKGNVFIAGRTYSKSGISTDDAHQPNIGLGEDPFIAKFNAEGQLLWGTYYGNEGRGVANSICSDSFGNVYVTGITNSKSSIATADATVTSLQGKSDAYVAVFNGNGKLLWGTYYGGEDNDIGWSICNFGYSIYVCGNTISRTGIATGNSHQQNFIGKAPYYDAFLVKFEFADIGILDLISPLGNTCGGKYDVLVRVKNFSNITQLDSFKIGWTVNGAKQEGLSWHGILAPGDTTFSINLGAADFRGGNNIIKIWTSKPNGSEDIDLANDTLTDTIYFYPTPVAETGEDMAICNGDSAVLGIDAVSGNIYSWASKPVGFISNSSKIKVSPSVTTIYYLIETDTTSGCTKQNSVIVTVYPYPEPEISGDSIICGQGKATFEVADNKGSEYSWFAEGGTIASGQGTSKIILQIHRLTKTGKVTVSEKNAGGCAGETSKEFIYLYSPLLDLGPDQYLCEEYDNLIKLDAGNGYISYLWYPTGDTSQYIIVRKVNDYFVVVADRCGNILKDEIKIGSDCPSKIFIPNAFSPNNDNLNETFQPLIENVTNYSFIIYNRWGEKIFISIDYNIGWDGNYKNKNSPQDVYFYQLECTVKEGPLARKLYKTGTLSLIR